MPYASCFLLTETTPAQQSCTDAVVAVQLQDKEELPPWLRKEQLEKLRAAEESGSLPFAVYLLGSVLVSIAAVRRRGSVKMPHWNQEPIVSIHPRECLHPGFVQVGSIFEIINKNPVFGVIQPDSPLWLPILGLFAVTGLPTAGAARFALHCHLQWCSVPGFLLLFDSAVLWKPSLLLVHCRVAVSEGCAGR